MNVEAADALEDPVPATRSKSNAAAVVATHRSASWIFLGECMSVLAGVGTQGGAPVEEHLAGLNDVEVRQ